jgi:hypothetical protein
VVVEGVVFADAVEAADAGHGLAFMRSKIRTLPEGVGRISNLGMSSGNWYTVGLGLRSDLCLIKIEV